MQQTTHTLCMVQFNFRKEIMNTADKVINDLAVQFANKTIECANYKALYEEAQAQLQKLQAEMQKETEKEEQ